MGAPESGDRYRCDWLGLAFKRWERTSVTGKTRVRPVCCALCSLCYWPTSTTLQNPHSPLNSWEVVYGAALGRLLGIPRDLICSVQDSPCPWFGRTWGLPRTLLDAGCVCWLVASKLYGIHGTSTYVYGKQDQRWPSEDELLNGLSPTIKINKESHIYWMGCITAGILLGWFLSMDPSGWFLAQERAWQPPWPFYLPWFARRCAATWSRAVLA